MRSEQECENVINNLDPNAVAGGQSKWPGMNYEQGVDMALRWVMEWSDDDPTED